MKISYGKLRVIARLILPFTNEKDSITHVCACAWFECTVVGGPTSGVCWRVLNTCIEFANRAQNAPLADRNIW